MQTLYNISMQAKIKEEKEKIIFIHQMNGFSHGESCSRIKRNIKKVEPLLRENRKWLRPTAKRESVPQ